MKLIYGDCLEVLKTYTNDGETVLDFTMGSGSTGVACKNTNREFIGIEKDEKYFNIAKERLK
jgi:site-specific DNA-methyltransferase (adenine-specific)